MLNFIKKYISTIFIAIFIPVVVFFAINQANINSLKGQLTINQIRSKVNANLIDNTKSYCNSYKNDLKSYILEPSNVIKTKLIEDIANLNIDLTSVVDPNSLSNNNYILNIAEISNLNSIYNILCENGESKLPAFKSELKNIEGNLKTTHINLDDRAMKIYSNARQECLETIKDKILNEDESILNIIIGDCISNSKAIKYNGEKEFEIEVTPGQNTKYQSFLLQADKEDTIEILQNQNPNSEDKTTPANGKIKINFNGLCNGLKCQKDYQLLAIALFSEDNKFLTAYLLALKFDENFTDPNDTIIKLTNENQKKVIENSESKVKLEINGNKEIEFIKVLLCDEQNCSGEIKKQIFGFCYEDFDKADKACNSIELSEDRLENNYSKNLSYSSNNLNAGENYYLIAVAYDQDGKKVQDIETISVIKNEIKKTELPKFFNCSNYFIDMSPSDPECEAVRYLREKGLFMGQNINNGIYANLNSELLRAEYFALASRLLEFKSPFNGPDIASRFNDITPNITSDLNNLWWLMPLGELIQNNVINGYSDNTIRPYNKLTQAELAKITGIAKRIFLPGSINLNKNPWYTDIVQAFNMRGIYINPEAVATRRDAVRIIYQSSLPSMLRNN